MKLQNKFFQNKFLLMSLLLMLAIPTANAAPRFALVGVGNYSKPTNSLYAGSVAAKYGYGGGALVEFRLGAKAGLEIGALYLQRKFTYTEGASSGDWTMTMVEAPVVLRFWLNHIISLGAGGYYASGLGKVKRTGSYTEATYSDLFLKARDFGAIGCLGFNIALGKAASLLLEGRYTLGLADTSSSTAGKFKHTDIQGFAGIRFGTGSK